MKFRKKKYFPECVWRSLRGTKSREKLENIFLSGGKEYPGDFFKSCLLLWGVYPAQSACRSGRRNLLLYWLEISENTLGLTSSRKIRWAKCWTKKVSAKSAYKIHPNSCWPLNNAPQNDSRWKLKWVSRNTSHCPLQKREQNWRFSPTGLTYSLLKLKSFLRKKQTKQNKNKKTKTKNP